MRKGIFLLMACLCFLTGCEKEEIGFTDISWTRETEADTETIFFGLTAVFIISVAAVIL